MNETHTQERLWIECDGCGGRIYHPQSKLGHELERRAICNRILLGCDDCLCWWCYVQWYDNSVTDREELKHRSRLARYQWQKEGKQDPIKIGG